MLQDNERWETEPLFGLECELGPGRRSKHNVNVSNHLDLNVLITVTTHPPSLPPTYRVLTLASNNCNEIHCVTFTWHFG